MTPEQARAALLVGLLACAGLLIANPVEPAMNAAILFDDVVDQRIEEESVGLSRRSNLVLRIRHDDGGLLTSDLDRVQALMMLEQEALDGSNPDTAWEAEDIRFDHIQTPFNLWSEAFASRNRSLAGASIWADVLQPTLEEGWCGNGSTPEEKSAFEATLLMLPGNANPGVACPAFAGADATQPPAATELIWMVWLDSDEEEADWGALEDWAAKVSENTEFEVTPVGVNMMFSKARDDANEDLAKVIFPSVILLGAMLIIGLRDLRTAAATLGGVVLVISAELGALSALGHTFSVIDGIAIPIIMGVTVDGAFWYCRSSRDRDEVRRMLFIAMMTTVAAVSLALFSPIRAQRSMAMVMIVGIILGWLVTRTLLEPYYLRRRAESMMDVDASEILPSHPAMTWAWPVALLLLCSIAVSSPAGVAVLNIDEFLPEDDPAIAEMDELQSNYVLASSTIAWIVVDVEGDSAEDLENLRDFQRQLGHHPSVIRLDSGLYRVPMVIGIPMEDDLGAGATIDGVALDDEGSLMVEDARLRRDGVTTGVAIAVLIDGENTDAALDFTSDVNALLDENGLQGEVGGDLPVGAEIARAFEEARVTQILLAGMAIFLVTWLVLDDYERAARIAIGTIAVGAAVDGMSGFLGGRGIFSAPAVLLGMGFAADYLAHASAEHAPTRSDTAARWWSALTSISVFVLLGFATFPPARDSGQLLTISILFSVLLATCLSLTRLVELKDPGPASPPPTSIEDA